MDTSLHRANRTEDESTSLQTKQEEGVEEEEHHIHLPNPSLWPFILTVAIMITASGLLFIPDNPWLTIVGAPLVLISIIGWAMEDPMAGPHAEVTASQRPVVPLGAKELIEQAEVVVQRTVTFGSTAYSTHPIKMDVDSPGVLTLHGKVELEAQRDELEERLRALPGVVDVHNYIVAEDAILNSANARLADMRTKGKLEGATNLSMLVENYILHLYGEVPTSDMKYALEREMLGIPGVRVVVNHIGLNKEIPGNLGRTLNKIGA